MSGSAIFFQEEEEQDNPRSRRKPDHANPIMKKRSSRADPPPTSLPAGELFSWQNASSRIIRVSRVSGGKDRHSKVWTVKGLRDRRVRLSVSTSIQFYDLQDRLGLDQPSKAVDWLINAAAPAIVHLPELQAPFPVPPLFAIPVVSRKSLKQQQQQPTTRSPAPPMDFGSGSVSEYLMKESGVPQIETSCFSSFLQYGSNPNMGLGMMAYNPVHLGEHQDLHRFSIMQDHVISPDVSSGVAGFGRETLQSNSQHLHHLAHGGNLPFFVSGAIPVAAAGAAGSLMENQFAGGFNGHLQLFCNEAYMYPELKGERKG